MSLSSALLPLWALLSGAPVASPVGSPPSVDASRVPYRTCTLEAVAFRTEKAGQVADACGRVWRTSDGGLAWTRDTALEDAASAATGRKSERSSEEYGPQTPGEGWVSTPVTVMHWLSGREG